MSPYQAALISAAIGNGGTTKVVDPKSGQASRNTTVIFRLGSGKTQVRDGEATIVRGSARKAFRAHGKPALGKLGAGGKTGSLMAEGRDLTWFSGFAPLDEPRYAVAVMIANHPTWHVKARLMLPVLPPAPNFPRAGLPCARKALRAEPRTMVASIADLSFPATEPENNRRVSRSLPDLGSTTLVVPPLPRSQR